MAKASLQGNKLRFLNDGIYVNERGNKSTWLADPILVTAYATSNEDTQSEQAFVKIEFKNRFGRWKEEIVPSYLLTGHNSEFVALLSNRGYIWSPRRKLRSEIIAALSVVKPDQRIHAVYVPGWHGDSLVLPDKAYTPNGPNHRNFSIRPNPTVRLGAFRRSGTLAQWQKIAKLCCHSSRARCLMAAAFTAPNLRLLKLPSFGLNLSGDTTSGKSSLIILASSVPGLNSIEGPDTWDGTAPAFEQRALGHRDSIMPLDDLGHVVGDPAEVAKLVTFRLASNRPKAKAGQYVLANNIVDGEFRVIALSTSEDPIWDHLTSEQRRRRVRGEEVRMINLPACVSRFGDVFDGPKADHRIGATIEERGQKIERYARLAVEYQGEAYRAYLDKLMTDKTAERKLKTYMAEYFSAAPSPEQHRWLRRVARYGAGLYASAVLAIDYGILPWSKKATLIDIRKCMNDAMEQMIENFSRRKNDPEFVYDGVKNLTEFKRRVDDAKFVLLDREAASKLTLRRRLERAPGFIRSDSSGKRRLFLFAKTFRSWYPNAAVRKALTKQLGSLGIFRRSRREDTRTREIYLAEFGGRIRCYSLSPSLLRRDALPV